MNVQKRMVTRNSLPAKGIERKESGSDVKAICQIPPSPLLKFWLESQMPHFRKEGGVPTMMVKKTISAMKKRKTGDKVGWKAEWLIELGDEIIKSLEILYNRIEQERIASKQW